MNESLLWNPTDVQKAANEDAARCERPPTSQRYIIEICCESDTTAFYGTTYPPDVRTVPNANRAEILDKQDFVLQSGVLVAEVLDPFSDEYHYPAD